MILAKLKLWGAAIVAGLVAVLAGYGWFYRNKAKREEERADQAEAEAARGRGYIEAEVKVEKEFRSRSREIAKEIEQHGTSSELDDPNHWVWETDDNH